MREERERERHGTRGLLKLCENISSDIGKIIGAKYLDNKMRKNNNCDKNSEISIVVVGDSRSGKTQLINKFQNFQFSKVNNLKFYL